MKSLTFVIQAAESPPPWPVRTPRSILMAAQLSNLSSYIQRQTPRRQRPTAVAAAAAAADI